MIRLADNIFPSPVVLKTALMLGLSGPSPKPYWDEKNQSPPQIKSPRLYICVESSRTSGALYWGGVPQYNFNDPRAGGSVLTGGFNFGGF